MTNRERMKAAVASKPKVGPRGGTGTPPKPSPPPPSVSLPVATVVYHCGHQHPVADFRGAFCPACRNKAGRDRAERNRAKRATVHQERPNAEQRLPDGATFHVAYDATAVQWTGTLTIRDGANSETTFTASASGVFRLLRELDGAYREWERSKA